MKKIITKLSICAAAVLFSTHGKENPPCPGLGHGKLLVHGGGGAPELLTKGVNLCGGANARVLIIPHALRDPNDPAYNSESPAERHETDIQMWLDTRAAAVDVLDFSDEERAVRFVSMADYIYFGGGSQKFLVEWFNRHPAVLTAIKNRHVAGALIGGASAGAAAMSEQMIQGAETADLTSLRTGGTRIIPGLGFWPEVITDQHFVKRQRWARLISAIIDHPTLVGVAIDEQTMVLVNREKKTFGVFGNGSVIVVDARHAQINDTETGTVQSARNLNVTTLRAGDTFKWK